VGATAMAEAIHQSKSLTSADLSHNSIGDVGIFAIAGAIQQSKSLNMVDLSGNLIGVIGITAISEAIKQSKSLAMGGFELQFNRRCWCRRHSRGYQAESVAIRGESG